jgi:phage I-like protein
MVLDRYRKRKLDKLPFDAGHGMAYGTDHKAYGWFVPDSENGELWSTKIQWNQIALDAFADRQYRFFSPWLYVGYEDGRAKELINIALTNIPATNAIKPLIADTRETPLYTTRKSVVQVPVQLDSGRTERENEMDPEIQKLLGILGVQTTQELSGKIHTLAQKCVTLESEKKESDAKVVELSTKVTTLETQNAELAQQVATLSTTSEEQKRSDLIATLSTAGKLPPNLHGWAKSCPLSALESFGKAAQPVAAASHNIQSPAVTAPTTLDVNAQEILTQFGLKSDPDAESKFQEMQAHLSAHQGAFVPSEFRTKFQAVKETK